VGFKDIEFRLIKFRTMSVNSDKAGLLTVGLRDQRITRIGYYLRKLKLDELPQLVNVLVGKMSLVGPRPEVRKYVNFYNEKQRSILNIKPGITDYASIAFVKENEILALSENPEKTYIEEIMPKKINLNMAYINNPNLKNYFRIILLTIKTIIKPN
jgi:lipopolysaccharide/colanic/teichoic acid biosynthesis glycosyltransferase